MKGNGHNQRPIHVMEVLGNAIIGGMENYVRNLLAHLSSDEFQITVIAPFTSAVTADMQRQGHEIIVMDVGAEPSWGSIQRTVKVLRDRKVDVLHAHLPNAFQLAAISGALTRCPVVTTLHGMHIDTLELSIQRLTSSHLIVVCQQALTHARSMGVAARHLTLIYNGVDATRFHPRNSGAQFRQSLGIPAEAPLVGFAGRLAHEKGPDIFLQAVGLVAGQNDDVHFVLVGTGPMEDELRATIAQLGLQERVHFGGLWDNMAGVYPAFDMLVQTSRVEGTPLVLLEAMASGLPIVATGVGGVIEVIEAGTTGLLSGRADWVDVGWKVLELLQQPERRRGMGQAGRERVLKNFRVQESAEKTGRLFRTLAGPQRRLATTRNEAYQRGGSSH